MHQSLSWARHAQSLNGELEVVGAFLGWTGSSAKLEQLSNDACDFLRNRVLLANECPRLGERVCEGRTRLGREAAQRDLEVETWKACSFRRVMHAKQHPSLLFPDYFTGDELGLLVQKEPKHIFAVAHFSNREMAIGFRCGSSLNRRYNTGYLVKHRLFLRLRIPARRS